ncbi:hypothetical protein NH340_JMT07009 [Sarcoptes scabiei]|nr:hypothetical protein NH340_JMT07009 [Sarcoptes scabiei]
MIRLDIFSGLVFFIIILFDALLSKNELINNFNYYNASRLTELVDRINRYSSLVFESRSIDLDLAQENFSFIWALENEKTLTVLEMNSRFKLIDCILFDLMKDHEIGERFIRQLRQDAHNHFGHYLADFNSILIANQLCRWSQWKKSDKAESNEIDDDGRGHKFQIWIEEIRRLTSKWIAPGTKWCGFGDMANEYWDLGRMNNVDICCREHDHCPIRLASNESNYGLRNRFKSTVSLCECDRMFFDCLEQSKSIYGQQIKWIYFNLLRLDCLEPTQCYRRWIWSDGQWRMSEKQSQQLCLKQFELKKFSLKRLN